MGAKTNRNHAHMQHISYLIPKLTSAKNILFFLCSFSSINEEGYCFSGDEPRDIQTNTSLTVCRDGGDGLVFRCSGGVLSYPESLT
jgi:hypothetical protein